MRLQLVRVFGSFIALVAVLGVTSVEAGDSQEERAERDRAIEEQLTKEIWRVSIPGPTAAAQPGVRTAAGVAESQVAGQFGPRGRHDRRDPRNGSGGDSRSTERREPARIDFTLHLSDLGSSGIPVGPEGRLTDELDRARYAQSGVAFYGVFDYVDAEVDDGVVLLTGYVTHEYKATKMVEFVSRVQGVTEVQNRIEVLPTSALDNQLRVRLARNIYGIPLLWNDATRVVPRVRIIVDNLHVRVAGVVFSNVEKRLVEDVVRQTAGVLTVQSDLEVETELGG